MPSTSTALAEQPETTPRSPAANSGSTHQSEGTQAAPREDDATPASQTPAAQRPDNPQPSPKNSQPLPYITLTGLVDLLGSTRSTIRHFADRLGFRFTVRHVGPRHKRTACLTAEQAATIATEVERDAADCCSSSSSSSSSSSAPPHDEATPDQQRRTTNPEPRTSASAEGLFYLLQLEPEHDPGRFKLGFSSDLESRLDDLLTVVPLAKLIATWPARRSWERIAIISTAQHAEPISQEVFRIERLEEAVAAANRFFAVMPRLTQPALALPESSPAYCSTLPRTPERPKERWFPTTDDPPLPQAATSSPPGNPASVSSTSAVPPQAADSPPGASPPVEPSASASTPTRLRRLSAERLILPAAQLTGPSAPGRVAVACESPP
jgi:hypothetical protein